MGHFKVLDGLRAIAVMIVIVSHAGMGHLVPGGFGVTLFFFLSGYLITTLMVIEWEKTNRLDFRGFYLRRTVRIIPPMLLCIVATLLLTSIGLQPREIRSEGLVWDFLFLANYAPQLGVPSGLPIPLWSLAVEEHFYLIFPALFVLSYRFFGRSGVQIFVVALIVLSPLVRMYEYANSPFPGDIYYWSHTRMDSILFGCLLAIWNNPATGSRVIIDQKSRYLILGGILVLATFVIRDEWFRQTIRYSIQGIGIFFIFNHVLRASNIVTRLLSSNTFKPVADYSYTLYLIHLPLLLCASLIPLPTAAQNIAGIAMAFLFAAISFRFMEQPLLQWRKSYQKRMCLPPDLRPKGIE